MSQRKCKECNYPYVKDDYCPNCGSKSPLQDSSSVFLGLIVIGFIVFIVSQFGSNSGGESSTSSTEIYSTDTVAADTMALQEQSPIEQSDSNISDKSFTVYNNTTENVFYAYAFYNDSALKWESTGWTSIAPNNSSLITFPSSFTGTNFFWYSISESGLEWSGDEPFCVHPTDHFDYYIESLNECSTESRGFIKQYLTDGKADIYISN